MEELAIEDLRKLCLRRADNSTEVGRKVEHAGKKIYIPVDH
jgi:hypothetical protein